MKVAIIGASGQIGAFIRDEALARDHQVTAIVRNPEKITVRRLSAVSRSRESKDCWLSAGLELLKSPLACSFWIR